MHSWRTATNGKRMFIFSGVAGDNERCRIGNTYHPDNDRGFGPGRPSGGLQCHPDVGFDVLREFWPEDSRNSSYPSVMNLTR